MPSQATRPPLVGLPAVWLRDNCPCPLGRDPVTFGYREAGAGLSAPPSMLAVRLRPGDRAVFDNTRVLHTRTGFAHGGRRHLQGCYVDLDGVESAVAVGDRATTGVTRRKDQT
jgi:gamma-butyrobetaine dioxygenase